MSRFKLSRRAVLRGAAGTGVALGLCPLDVMFDPHGEAYAQGMPAPKRLVVTFMGNGAPIGQYIDTHGTYYPGSWVPASEGADYPLSPCLQPLASVRQHVRVMSGLWNPSTGVRSHAGNFSAILSGLCNEESYRTEGHSPNQIGGPSADFVASKTLRGSSRFALLPVGVSKASQYETYAIGNLSFDDDGLPVPSEFSPRAVFDFLFRDFTPPGAPPPETDPRAVRRQSVLDAVKRDAERLKTQLGVSDRHKLDRHLTAIRELEQRLATTPTPTTPACVVPTAPVSSSEIPAIADQMIELVTLALACDQTRVASLLLTNCTNVQTMDWLGLPKTFHEYSHWDTTAELDTWRTNMTRITAWHVEMYAKLVKRLAETPEGGGTLLDNTLAVFLSENGNSETHGCDDMPLLVAGGPQLVRGNFHWRGRGGYYTPDQGPSSSSLWLSVLQALGSPVSQFGGVRSGVPLR